MFNPNIREIIQFDQYFFNGWFNHQHLRSTLDLLLGRAILQTLLVGFFFLSRALEGWDTLSMMFFFEKTLKQVCRVESFGRINQYTYVLRFICLCTFVCTYIGIFAYVYI